VGGVVHARGGVGELLAESLRHGVELALHDGCVEVDLREVDRTRPDLQTAVDGSLGVVGGADELHDRWVGLAEVL
jgi:hypothetical protein